VALWLEPAHPDPAAARARVLARTLTALVLQAAWLADYMWACFDEHLAIGGAFFATSMRQQVWQQWCRLLRGVWVVPRLFSDCPADYPTPQSALLATDAIDRGDACENPAQELSELCRVVHGSCGLGHMRIKKTHTSAVASQAS
jgi:hypothetical protein